MASLLTPYLSFRNDARQAMEFYQQVFGGELKVNTFGEYGMAGTPDADLIMHGQLETPSGFTLMGADTPAGMDYTPGTNSPSASAEMTQMIFEAISHSSPRAARCRSRWRSRCGVTSSAPVWTGSASRGWRTSAPRVEPRLATADAIRHRPA